MKQVCDFYDDKDEPLCMLSYEICMPFFERASCEQNVENKQRKCCKHFFAIHLYVFQSGY